MVQKKITRSLLSLIGAFAIIAAACGSDSSTETSSGAESSSEGTDGDPGDSAEAEESSGNESPDEEQAAEKFEEEIQTVDDFESYAAGDELPENWTVYGNAAGDIGAVSGDDSSTRAKRVITSCSRGALTQMLILGSGHSNLPNHRTDRLYWNSIPLFRRW